MQAPNITVSTATATPPRPMADVASAHPPSPGAPRPDVVISCGSRFFAFDLARELHKAGALHSVYSGYPRYPVERWGVPRERFTSVGMHEALSRGQAYLHRFKLLPRRYDYELSDRYDRLVARRLAAGGNVFVGYSSQSLHSVRAARRLGMLTIVERLSAHIDWHREALTAEAKRTGLPVETIDRRTIDRELAEYDEADMICLLSEFARATFIERGVDPKRLMVNQPGVSLEQFRSRERPPRTWDNLRVLHVGRVTAQKGAHYLVPAVERVRGATLTLVGPVDPGMERVVARPHTTVVGAVAGSQLPSHYASADVYCLLSIQDGFAVTVTQAMAMGLPVIVTTTTGASELVTDGVEGFVVPPRDPDAVADRLRLLASDDALRQAMGERARAKVASGFTWADYGRRAQRHYAAALERRARPAGAL